MGGAAEVDGGDEDGWLAVEEDEEVGGETALERTTSVGTNAVLDEADEEMELDMAATTALDQTVVEVRRTSNLSNRRVDEGSAQWRLCRMSAYC